MKKLLSFFALLALLPSLVFAQPSNGGGPGPGPTPNPWVVSGAQIYYGQGCVTVSATTPGACNGTGSLNSDTLFTSGTARIATGLANNWTFAGAAAMASPRITVSGSDTNIDMSFLTKGAGGYLFQTGTAGNTQFAVFATSGANRYISVIGSNGSNPTLATSAGGLVIAPFNGVTTVTGALFTSSALTVQAGGAAITGNTSVSSGTFTASGGAFTASPASANVVMSPTGTGVVTINPATAGAMNNMVIGGSTPLAGTFTGLTATGAVALSPSNNNVVISPTGTGLVTINPATAGTMDNVAIGGSTPLAGAFTSLTATGQASIRTGTAIPAGGATTTGYLATSTSNYGVFFGSGAPTLSAAQGSLYLRSDGLPYYNTSGSTTWGALVDLVTAQSFTATKSFLGSSSAVAAKLTNVAEPAVIGATAATGTINYDVCGQSVLYYTSNAAANWTVNLRCTSGTSLNTAMTTGDVITVVFMVTQGGTAYYNNALQVDGNSVTPKYQGGTAWSAGNINGIDTYTYAIIKTGNAAFTVLASQTQFK